MTKKAKLWVSKTWI